MKTLRIFFFFCLLVIAGSYTWWVQTAPGIPVSRTIMNSEGQSLEVVIVGRTGQSLHFDRISDGGRYELALGKLGWKDRIFAERLPEQAPPPVEVKEEDQSGDPYIASRRQRIGELQQKKTEFIAEIKSGSLNNILARKRQEDLVSLEKEILDLQGAIDAYVSRTGNK
jgi:hypothetical protein